MDIPATAPIMTLGETVFFPHVVLPLYIFEQRYRQMLADCLRGDRMFVVSCRQEENDGDFPNADPQPCTIATIGMIRAAHRNNDGTSNLVLQGLQRVRITAIIEEEPYRMVSIEPLLSEPIADEPKLLHIRDQIRELLKNEKELGNETPEEFLDFLESLMDHATYIDLLTYSVCACHTIKQSILEAKSIEQRFELLLAHLRQKYNLESLINELQSRFSLGASGLN